MGPRIDTGDTAWLLCATALVLLMTPGLALFYGGMVRAKNVLSTFLHSFMALGLVTLQWVLVGYSLAFSGDHGGFIGGLDRALLRGVSLGPLAGQTTPELLFMAYQLMFAIITPALISGAFAERLKFSSYAVFTVVWTTVVYDPIAHWVWAPGGWLAQRGALDFAGGTVVHISSGVSALVFALVLGRRRGYPREKHVPHNLTMTAIGAGLLWFGWLGFNAGSAPGASGLAALALVNSQGAAAAGALAWTGIEWARLGKPNLLGFASGLVAGLVAVTPAAGFVSPMWALVIGLAAGTICYGAVLAKGRFGYDDTLDAFGVHGIGGATGALLTGVFCAKAWNPGGQDGLLAGHAGQLYTQALATVSAAAYAAVLTYGILLVLDRVLGLRVEAEDEYDGLDLSLHGERGYAFDVVAHGHAPTSRPDQEDRDHISRRDSSARESVT
jgi:Amt family ammonium transporter